MPRGQDNVGLLAATMHAALVATRQTYGEAALETLRRRCGIGLPWISGLWCGGKWEWT